MTSSVIIASPAGVLDLDIHTTLETDPFKDPSSPVHALAAPITSPFLCLDSSKPFGDLSNSDSPDSLSPPDPHKIAIARWRSKVALRSSSSETSSPSTLVLPSTTIASSVSRQIILAPPRIPRRYAILVLPGQEIPFGRPYRT
ncbi:hypothetical protein Tco_0408906 [Tanacetum coccineum]